MATQSHTVTVTERTLEVMHALCVAHACSFGFEGAAEEFSIHCGKPNKTELGSLKASIDAAYKAATGRSLEGYELLLPKKAAKKRSKKVPVAAPAPAEPPCPTTPSSEPAEAPMERWEEAMQEEQEYIDAEAEMAENEPPEQFDA